MLFTELWGGNTGVAGSIKVLGGSCTLSYDCRLVTGIEAEKEVRYGVLY